jgi:Baseplate J-like protein
MSLPTSNSSACRCDRLVFPPKPNIPAGLSSLPRQLAGFPEFRLAMLGQIPAHVLMDAAEFPVNLQRPLRAWRAREGEDLGIMLLEMWAYVLDILAFYDERIANEGYLPTAIRPASLQELVALIGYLPRPAIGAEVILGVLADTGKGLIKVPAGTAFRSGAFDAEKPQIFETAEDRTIDPAFNEWTLAPIRGESLDRKLTMPLGDTGLSRDDLCLLTWQVGPGDQLFPVDPPAGHPATLVDAGNSLNTVYSAPQDSFRIASGGTSTKATRAVAVRVQNVTPSQALDGETYNDLTLEPAPAIDPEVSITDIAVWKPTLRSGVSKVENGFVSAYIELDSLQSAIRAGDIVLIQRGDAIRPFRVTDLGQGTMLLGAPPASPRAVHPFLQVTRLGLFPSLPDTWTGPVGRLSVQFGLVRAGTLTSLAKFRLGVDDLRPSAPFETPVEPPTLAPPGAVLMAGADGSGANLTASIVIESPQGTGSLTPQQSAETFATALRTPVKVFGNLIRATRGETVRNEVLGNGNAAVPFQSFKVKKKPLTYLSDESAPNGRRSTLAVRVNAILWEERSSFFGTGPQDEVYIVRQNEDGESIVTFGDGKTGARLPSGVKNVTATYRNGAGAAKPPANSITQMSRPVPGIRRVVNPVGAGGGADADKPKDLRQNAPESSLLLGRAVSLPDFEALAREFGGVLNARATWAWDGMLQRAVVKIWFISDGGSIAQDLRKFLLGQSDPNTPIAVCEATALSSSLTVDLIVAARFRSDEVEQAVAEALTESEKGLLAPENIPIGLPLFRSAILEQIHAVPGVASVRAMRFNGAEAPFGIAAGEGEYRDFSLVVGNTAVGEVLFAPGT